MRNSNKFMAGTALLVLGLAMASSPVRAQDANAAPAGANSQCTDDAGSPIDCPATPSAEAAPSEIVVTGSRIRRPELESPVPVTTLAGDAIYQQSGHNMGDALNDLPQLRSTFAQQNPGLGIGVAGLNLLDLRGLGPQRTLVLVNGRRHVPGDLQVTASAVDINTIPIDLVDRIDIVTGGNSAVYGSDAISGVVNFILKRDYEGLEVRGGAGVPEYGEGANYFLSGLAGTNFNEGRGNIAASVEYSRQNRLFASDIPWKRHPYSFLTVDADASGSDGIPDRALIKDSRSGTISRYGLVPFPQAPGTAPCGTTTPNGSGETQPYNCNYLFTSTGDLVPQTGIGRTGTSVYSGYIGGNGETGNEDRLTSVLPFQERYVGNILGHYTFSDAAEFFFEGTFARSRSIGSNSGPAFDQGQFITFNDARSQFRLDNPFLSAAARNTISNAMLASGQNNGILNVFGPLTAADRAAIADGSYRFVLAKNFLDLGIRDEDAQRDTYRFVAGMRGDFSDHLSYEVSANYGRMDEDITILGNVNVQRLMLALDAGRNPATGQIQCRSQFDPDAAYAAVDDVGNPDIAQDRLADDIAACVPYNPFGAPDNTAARDYIVSDSGDHGRLTQFDVTGFISGDTGSFFNLPGGPVAFALGGEYRREDAFFEADPIVNSGLTFLNSLQTFDPDVMEVKEAFGELSLPILKDRPFFDDLSVSGAVRVSDYNSGAGTVWAYNAGGEWAPIPDIRFRANYGRAIRAPNYTETDAPLGQNFAPGFEDPCSVNRIGSGSQYRQANCEADLGGILGNDRFEQKVGGTYSLEILSGSNPNLSAETSNSLTVGAVIQPRFVPGLALTIDYYDIQVNDVITSPTAQQIVNSCYDLASLDNQFCDLVQRYKGTGTGPNGEVPGEILVGTLQQVPLNFAKRIRRGIDAELTYRNEIATNTYLNLRAYYTHNLKVSDYQDPTNPDFEDRILSELGDPKDEVSLDAALTVNKFTFGYGLHYIGPMLTSAYEDYFSLQGRPAQNADAYSIREYPEVVYHDLRFSWQIGGDGDSKPLEFYVGVDNVFNKTPPLDATGLGAGSSIYDIRGRAYYSGFKASF